MSRPGNLGGSDSWDGVIDTRRLIIAADLLKYVEHYRHGCNNEVGWTAAQSPARPGSLGYIGVN